MTWFYVDDQLSDHKKVTRIPRKDDRRVKAMGLWVLAGAWARRHRTDGWVPTHQVEEVGGSEEAASDLVMCGMWRHHKLDDEDGYVYVDWAQWQTTREQEEEDRAAGAERQRRYRQRHKGGERAPKGQGSLFEDERNGVTDDVSDGVGDDVSDGVTDASATPNEVTRNAPVRDSPRSPRSPRSPQTTNPPTEGSARDAADATSDADAEGESGELPGMPSPPPRRDNRTPSQKLVDLWISELCQGVRPPNRTIGHLGRELSVLLNRDKIALDEVEAGLRRWHDLRLTPSQLANVVHELRIADTPQASNYTRRPVNGAKPSHTDARVAAGLSAIEKLRAAEEAEAAAHAPREITR